MIGSYMPRSVRSPARGRRSAARFLFVVPPLTGHVNPAVSVAMELSARGHAVAWSAPRLVRRLLPERSVVYEVDPKVSERLHAALVENPGRDPVADFKTAWEELFVPFARGTLEDVERAVDEFEPDVVVADQHALAGSFAARRRSVAWATLGPTVAIRRAPPQYESWLDAQLAELQLEAGLEPAPRADLSPQLVLAFFTAPLLDTCRGLPAASRLVGPALAHRRALPAEHDAFPWRLLEPRRRVLVSLGSLVSRQPGRFFRVLRDALGGCDLQVIVAAPDGLDAPPANFLVRPSLPILALLEHVDCVVCHGGQNTVNEALAHGLPLVVSPLAFGTGWAVARQVVDAGAGVRVRSARLSAGELRAAVLEVLEDPRYREAARRLRASFEEAGGARAAADELELLAGSRAAA